MSKYKQVKKLREVKKYQGKYVKNDKQVVK